MWESLAFVLQAIRGGETCWLLEWMELSFQELAKCPAMIGQLLARGVCPMKQANVGLVAQHPLLFDA